MHKRSLFVFVSISILMLICIYYANILLILLGLSQCDWPDISGRKSSDNYTNVMLLTDIHLRYDNNIFNHSENLWREYQMSWSFGLAKRTFEPEAIFILGDLFDDGINYDQKQFDNLYDKFSKLFSYERYRLLDNTTRTNGQPVMFAINGNHDIGWHYEMTPTLKHRFDEALHTHSMQHFTINDLNFVAINSITMEGDYCQLCAQAEHQLKHIARRLCPKKPCLKKNQPIILTHYPLFKQGLQKCGSDWDTRPGGDLYWDKSVQKWNCFNSNATDRILSLLRPRLVFNGHTHYGCVTRYDKNAIEWTIASFNYRYLYNPTFLLMRINGSDYAIKKCHLIHGSVFYLFDFLIISIFVIFLLKSIVAKINRQNFRGYVRINFARA